MPFVQKKAFPEARAWRPPLDEPGRVHRLLGCVLRTEDDANQSPTMSPNCLTSLPSDITGTVFRLRAAYANVAVTAAWSGTTAPAIGCGPIKFGVSSLRMLMVGTCRKPFTRGMSDAVARM